MSHINWFNWTRGPDWYSLPYPTYGLYGGEGWTDGHFGGDNYGRPGLDALDEAFREHDIAYSVPGGDRAAADAALVAVMSFFIRPLQDQIAKAFRER